MITKNDTILLITEIQNNGVDCTQALKRATLESQVSLETLKFIDDNRPLDLKQFYEKLRKSYNEHHSKLYKNIVSFDADVEINEVPAILNSYTMQVLLFSKSLQNKQLFFKFSRLEEVYRCLHYYSKTYDLIPCVKMMNLLRADIKTLEEIYRKL